MKYVIWGTGIRGKRLFDILTSDFVAAFIDNDISKQSQEHFEKPVINFEEYKKNYSTSTIIISILEYKEIEKFLEKEGFYNYVVFDGMDVDYWHFIEQSLLKYKPTDRVGIFGANFLGLMILDYFLKKNFKNFGIIEEIRNKYNIYLHRFQFLDNFESLSHIIITNDDWEKFIVKYPKNINIDDLSNCYNKVTKYHNPKLIKFKNIHLGKRCFIVGNGPSLTFKDLECLHEHNEISFGVNLVYRSFDKVSWHPNYFFMHDEIEKHKKELNILDLPCIFIGSRGGV